MGLRGGLLAAVATAALMGGAAGAQDAGETGDDVAPRETVTVYGTKNPVPVFDYPGQVSVVTREEIELFAPSAISDLLRATPGLEMSGGPRRTGETPSLRGTGRDNVLILLDGARQSFTSAHDGAAFLDPELIKTAEVVRGPASSLYGSGAIGGVIAFETVDAADFLDADETTGARLRFGGQEVNGEVLGVATLFVRRGALDGVASFGVRDSGDIALGSGATLTSDDHIETALLKGTVGIAPGFEAELSWQGFRNDAVEPNNGQGTAEGGDVAKNVSSDTFRLGAKINPASRSLLDARVTLWAGDHEVEEFDATVPRRITRLIESVGLSADNRVQTGLGLLTFGADWWRDQQTGRDDTTGDGARDGVPDGESEFLGAFVQLESQVDRPLGLPGDLVVIPGVRFDRFDSTAQGVAGENSDERVSPRLAASYGPSDWFRVFASWSQGFRAPSLNELYLDGVHFPVPHPVLFKPPSDFTMVNNNFIANPSLKPETATTIEAGVGVRFDGLAVDGDRLQAKVSRWESEVDDLVNLFVDFSYAATCFTSPFFPCDAGTTQSKNVASATLDGWEAEAFYDAERAFARARFSTIDGEDQTTGDKLGILTPPRLNLDARVKFPGLGSALGARVEIADDFDKVNDPAEERDGYEVVDLYATWRPAFADGVRIDIGVDNVFDADYERVFAGVSEPGRNARVAVSYARAR